MILYIMEASNDKTRRIKRVSKIMGVVSLVSSVIVLTVIVILMATNIIKTLPTTTTNNMNNGTSPNTNTQQYNYQSIHSSEPPIYRFVWNDVNKLWRWSEVNTGVWGNSNDLNDCIKTPPKIRSQQFRYSSVNDNIPQHGSILNHGNRGQISIPYRTMIIQKHHRRFNNNNNDNNGNVLVSTWVIHPDDIPNRTKIIIKNVPPNMFGMYVNQKNDKHKRGFNHFDMNNKIGITGNGTWMWNTQDNKWHLKQSAPEMVKPQQITTSLNTPPLITPPHTKTTTNHESMSSTNIQ